MRRRPGVVLALAFLAGNAVERLLHAGHGTLAAEVAGALLLSAPMLVVHRRPPVAAAGLVAGAIANGLLDATPVQDLFATVVALIVVAYVTARHHGRRLLAGTLAILAGGLALGESLVPTDGLVFIVFVIAGGALGGALVRRRAELTRELAERTQELHALREARERDAALSERRRIARELHDVVAHTVSVMVVQAAGARRQAARDPARALAALDQVEATGRETLTELRRLFGLLHGDPGAIGLADLPALAARVRAAGVPVDVVVEGTPRALDPDADLAAYRLVQEALTNTLKHAGPARAVVAVRWAADAVELVVRDTGRGGVQADGARRGLVGMRERMALFDGYMEAGPLAAGGFEVRARLPLAREEVHAA